MAAQSTIHAAAPKANAAPLASSSFKLDSLVRKGLYVHELPGRLRIETPAIKWDSAMAARLRAQICAAPGVTRLEINQTTGRVLVCFNPALTSGDRIAGILHQAGCFTDLESLSAQRASAAASVHPAANLLVKLATEELARFTLQALVSTLF